MNEHLAMYFLESLTAIAFHSYRTARVSGRIMESGYESGDKIFELERRLCKQLGKAPDNHIAITVQTDKGHVYHLSFSDWRFAIGDTLEMRNW